MDVTNLKTIKKLCNEYELYPKKSKGQNFLLSKDIIKNIVKKSKITKNDTVLEIGPGFGALTEELAKNSKQVIAVELDDRIAYALKNNLLQDYSNITIEHIDILKFNLLNLPKDYVVVANLPYSISSAVLRVILSSKNLPKSITVMVQKEVANRITSKKGSMSILSVSVQYYGKVKKVIDVSSGNFWPEPKVDSAVIHINDIHRDNDIDDKDFFRLVKTGFSSPRKLLVNNLLASFEFKKETIQQELELMGLSSKARAQELSVGQWKKLYHKLHF